MQLRPIRFLLRSPVLMVVLGASADVADLTGLAVVHCVDGAEEASFLEEFVESVVAEER